MSRCTSQSALCLTIHVILMASCDAAFVQTPSPATQRDTPRLPSGPNGHAALKKTPLRSRRTQRYDCNFALRLRGGLSGSSALATEEPLGERGGRIREYSGEGLLVGEKQGGPAVVEALGARVRLAARATFLPAGYPASVPPEYARYQECPRPIETDVFDATVQAGEISMIFSRDVMNLHNFRSGRIHREDGSIGLQSGLLFDTRLATKSTNHF